MDATVMTTDRFAGQLAGQLADRIAGQMRARAQRPDEARIKVNLYTGAETRAVAEAAGALAAQGMPSRIDCLMVADSYLMTHLGRPSTRIDDPAERAEFFALLRRLVGEVVVAVEDFPTGERPWIMADLPDGAAATPALAVASVARMIDAGAAMVKLEVAGEDSFAAIAAAAGRGLPVAAHIGYTPQSRENRRYGATPEEAQALFAEARRARDHGARAIVIERVEPAVNAALCRPHREGLPVYAIFSGWVPHGGQSLNVFDSVVRPDFAAKAFPPTATLTRADLPDGYTHDAIVRHFQALLALAHGGRYPPKASRPAGALDELLATIDPWTR